MKDVYLNEKKIPPASPGEKINKGDLFLYLAHNNVKPSGLVAVEAFTVPENGKIDYYVIGRVEVKDRIKKYRVSQSQVNYWDCEAKDEEEAIAMAMMNKATATGFGDFKISAVTKD